MCIHGGTASLHIVQCARSTRPDRPSTGVTSAAATRRAASDPFTGHQCMCEANVDASSRPREIHERDTHDRGRSRAQSTNVSISRLRVDMTSRRGGVCSRLFDRCRRDPPSHSACRVPSARFVSKEQKTMVNSRGFIERRAAWKNALTPVQYVTEDFPVLSADPTPHVPLEQWSSRSMRVRMFRRRDWRAFRELPPSASPQTSIV
jgi:hypothetical protein